MIKMATVSSSRARSSELVAIERDARMLTEPYPAVSNRKV